MSTLKDYEYYRTENGVLYCGKCEIILPLINKEIENNNIDEIDLVLTDPPYGMKYHSGHYKDGNPHEKIKGDDKYPVEMIDAFIDMSNKAVFSFCRWDNLHEVKKPNSFIIWQKNNWSAGDLKHEYGRMYEGILFYASINHKFKKRKPDIIRCDRVPPTQLTHPTEKPVGLLIDLIDNNTELHDMVIDPYCGTGSSLVASCRLNRRWIGIEISEKYCEIAKKRIKKEYDQFKMF
jgi:site-specific DNA-methyltransferase (adenine-specific)